MAKKRSIFLFLVLGCSFMFGMKSEKQKGKPKRRKVSENNCEKILEELMQQLIFTNQAKFEELEKKLSNLEMKIGGILKLLLQQGPTMFSPRGERDLDLSSEGSSPRGESNGYSSESFDSSPEPSPRDYSPSSGSLSPETERRGKKSPEFYQKGGSNDCWEDGGSLSTPRGHRIPRLCRTSPRQLRREALVASQKNKLGRRQRGFTRRSKSMPEGAMTEFINEKKKPN